MCLCGSACKVLLELNKMALEFIMPQYSQDIFEKIKQEGLFVQLVEPGLQHEVDCDSQGCRGGSRKHPVSPRVPAGALLGGCLHPGLGAPSDGAEPAHSLCSGSQCQSVDMEKDMINPKYMILYMRILEWVLMFRGKRII